MRARQVQYWGDGTKPLEAVLLVHKFNYTDRVGFREHSKPQKQTLKAIPFVSTTVIRRDLGAADWVQHSAVLSTLIMVSPGFPFNRDNLAFTLPSPN